MIPELKEGKKIIMNKFLDLRDSVGSRINVEDTSANLDIMKIIFMIGKIFKSNDNTTESNRR